MIEATESRVTPSSRACSVASSTSAPRAASSAIAPSSRHSTGTSTPDSATVCAIAGVSTTTRRAPESRTIHSTCDADDEG